MRWLEREDAEQSLTSMTGKNIINSDRSVDWQAREWLRVLTSGRVTERDASAFRDWRAQNHAHAIALQKAKQEWDALAQAGAIVRERLHAAPDTLTATGRQRRRLLGWGLAAGGAAAAVTLALSPPLGLWPALDELAADYRTSPGEQRHIHLENGLDVMMNTRTSMRVTQTGDRNELDLLNGEAALVCRQRVGTLDVRAGMGTVRLALGEFEIRVDPGGLVTLRCNEGAGSLTHPAGTVKLVANQQIRYDDRQLFPLSTEVADVSPWRSGFVVFRDTPIAFVVAEINRYRPGKVILLNTPSAGKLSGRFAIDRLDQALAQIEAIFQLKKRTLPGNILLLG